PPPLTPAGGHPLGGSCSADKRSQFSAPTGPPRHPRVTRTTSIRPDLQRPRRRGMGRFRKSRP
ncbi:hypothetical protein WMY93_033401, partial [Mugilogobius chulae]